jgi:hypothetical protein
MARQRSVIACRKVISMVANEPRPQLHLAAPVVAFDADFDARWAAWVARGRAHEQRVRRRFVVWAGVLTMAAAIVAAFLR